MSRNDIEGCQSCKRPFYWSSDKVKPIYCSVCFEETLKLLDEKHINVEWLARQAEERKYMSKKKQEWQLTPEEVEELKNLNILMSGIEGRLEQLIVEKGVFIISKRDFWRRIENRLKLNPEHLHRIDGDKVVILSETKC